MTYAIFDTHTHLNDENLYGEADDIIKRASEAGVLRMLVPGYDQESSRRAVELAAKYTQVYAAVGVHPHDAKSVTDKDLADLEAWADEPKVVAIGEIGLDYHYDHSPRDVQARVFAAQLEVAKRKGLPVVIHDREAHADVLAHLRSASPLLRGGIMHSFSGSVEMAADCLKMGLYLSFSGPLTFKNAERLRKVATALPLDRLLVETDAPYLTPEPYRGRRNEPAHVRHVLAKLIEIRPEMADAVAAAVYQNALRVFQMQE